MFVRFSSGGRFVIRPKGTASGLDPLSDFKRLPDEITSSLFENRFWILSIGWEIPTLQKSRMPQILGVEGEAVVLYREPSTTQEMRYPRLSRRINKMAVFSCF